MEISTDGVSDVRLVTSTGSVKNSAGIEDDWNRGHFHPKDLKEVKELGYQGNESVYKA